MLLSCRYSKHAWSGGGQIRARRSHCAVLLTANESEYKVPVQCFDIFRMLVEGMRINVSG